MKHNRRYTSSAFTLIELLIVIAIIAILAIVVVLVLNPIQIFYQSRDSNRLSDLATMNEAIGVYLASSPSASLGNSSTTYISIPDPTATSTAGDQCQGLNLPALPTGWIYQCAASSTYRKTDGTGWIPINFQGSPLGSPIGSLPIDPTNQTSSGLYYTYTTNGSQYEITSLLESSKYKTQFMTEPPITDYPEVAAQGSNLSLSALWNPSGLIGYWPFDEGAGGTVNDASNNGNGGAWVGTPAGSSGYYSGGKVGSWAGYFNGTNDYVNISSTAAIGFATSDFSVVAWINRGATSRSDYIIGKKQSTGSTAPGYMLGIPSYNNFIGNWMSDGVTVSSTPNGVTNLNAGQWYLEAWSVQRASSSQMYTNGLADGSAFNDSGIGSISTTFPLTIGQLGGVYFLGSVDDVRIYNRALSAAEVQAIYNAEH